MSNTPKEIITITEEGYDRLLKDSTFLYYLDAAGLDNWEGYEIAKEEKLENED